MKAWTWMIALAFLFSTFSAAEAKQPKKVKAKVYKVSPHKKKKIHKKATVHHVVAGKVERGDKCDVQKAFEKWLESYLRLDMKLHENKASRVMKAVDEYYWAKSDANKKKKEAFAMLKVLNDQKSKDTKAIKATMAKLHTAKQEALKAKIAKYKAIGAALDPIEEMKLTMGTKKYWDEHNKKKGMHDCDCMKK